MRGAGWMSGGVSKAVRKSALCCHSRDLLAKTVSEKKKSLQYAVKKGKCIKMIYKPLKYETARFTHL